MSKLQKVIMLTLTLATLNLQGFPGAKPGGVVSLHTRPQIQALDHLRKE